MGTHPIFESDFDCLTETMNLTDLGSALENSIKRAAGGGGAKMTELEHWIQMELGSTLAELVNEELTSNGGAMSNEAIVTRVINSSVYAEATSELHHRLVARLTQIKERYARPGTIDSGDCSLSLQTSSSLSSSRSLFYTRDQLEQLYASIESNPSDIMGQLVKLCGDNSIEELFREGLEAQILYALRCGDSYHVTSQFLARILNTGSQNEVRRAHTVLVSYLMSEDERSDDEIRLVRLLNELYCDLPLIWSRYKEDIVADIVAECFTLFSQETYYAVISRLDPTAAWYRSWLHAHNSRSAIVAHFTTTDAVFIRHAAHHVTTFDPTQIDSSLLHSFRVLQYSLAWPSFHAFIPGLNDLFRATIHRTFRHNDQVDEAALDLLLSAASERREVATAVYTRDMVDLLIAQLPDDKMARVLSALALRRDDLCAVVAVALVRAELLDKFEKNDAYQALLAIIFRSHVAVDALKSDSNFTTDQLLSLAQTGAGLALVYESGAVSDVAQLLQSRLKHKLGAKGELFERFGCGYLLTHLAATEFGARALVEADYAKLVVAETWLLVQSLPLGEEHGRRARKKAQNVLGNLLSSAASVRCFLTRQSDGDDYDEPSSIFQLFESLLNPSKAEKLFCPDDAITFALEMILLVSHSIESFVYFDEQLNITRHLQAQLRESTVIDANLALIKRILARSTSINGLKVKSRLVSATKRPKQSAVKDMGELKELVWRYLSSSTHEPQLIVFYLKKWLSFTKSSAKIETKQASGKPSKLFSRCNEMIFDCFNCQLKKADFDRFMRQRHSTAHASQPAYDWLCAVLVLIVDDRELTDKLLAASSTTWSMWRHKSPHSALLTRVGD